LKSTWNKHGYFNVIGSTMPIFVIEIVTDFFQNEQLLILENSDQKIDKNQSQNEQGYFNVTGLTVQKIGRAGVPCMT